MSVIFDPLYVLKGGRPVKTNYYAIPLFRMQLVILACLDCWLDSTNCKGDTIVPFRMYKRSLLQGFNFK